MAVPRKCQCALVWVIPILLVGGSISLPRCRNAHPVGVVAHQLLSHGSTHGRQNHAGRSRSHSHDHHHGADVGTAHLHVVILWFEFTIPASEDADPCDPSGTKSNSIPVFVQPASGWLPITSDSSSQSSGRWTNLRCCSTKTTGYTVTQDDALLAASSGPLCDRARHERSGVRRC